MKVEIVDLSQRLGCVGAGVPSAQARMLAETVRAA